MRGELSNKRKSFFESIAELANEGYKSFTKVGQTEIRANKRESEDTKVIDFFEEEKRIFKNKAEIARDAIKRLVVEIDRRNKQFGLGARRKQPYNEKKGKNITTNDIKELQRYMDAIRNLVKKAKIRDMEYGYSKSESGPICSSIKAIVFEAMEIYDLAQYSYFLDSDPKSEKELRHKISSANLEAARRSGKEPMNNINIPVNNYEMDR